MNCEILPINGLTEQTSENEIRINLLKRRACMPLLDIVGESPTANRVRAEILEARKKNIYLGLYDSHQRRPSSLSVLNYIRSSMALYGEQVDLSGNDSPIEMDKSLLAIKGNVVVPESQKYTEFPHLKINHIFHQLASSEDPRTSMIRNWLGLNDGTPHEYETQDREYPAFVTDFAEDLDSHSTPHEIFLRAYWSTPNRSDAESLLGVSSKRITEYLKEIRDTYDFKTIEETYLYMIDTGQISPHTETDEPEIIEVSERQLQIMDILVRSGRSNEDISLAMGLTPDQVRSSISLLCAKTGIRAEARDQRFRAFQWYMQNDVKLIVNPQYSSIDEALPHAVVNNSGTITVEPVEQLAKINPKVIQLFQAIADNPTTELHNLQVGDLNSSQINYHLSTWKKRMSADSNEETLLIFWRMGLVTIPPHDTQEERPTHRPEDKRLERLLRVFLSTGHSQKKLAETLHLSPQVVEGYTGDLMHAWGVGRRRELLIEAIKRGKLQLSDKLIST